MGTFSAPKLLKEQPRARQRAQLLAAKGERKIFKTANILSAKTAIVLPCPSIKNTKISTANIE